uniref:HTH merR-type domain-containing protein n=1 Tax=candidate division WOR-3 bacterium TaxID=2052148 RepID=A0A7V3RH49_UNCW3
MPERQKIKRGINLKKIPDYMKVMPKDWVGYDDLDIDDAVTEEQRLGISLHHIYRELSKPMLTAKDIKHLTGLSYRNLNEWERRNIKIGGRIGIGDHSWRLFSIEDAIYFILLLKLKGLGIPISKNAELIERLKKKNWILEVLGSFSVDEDIVLITDFDQIFEILLAGHEYRYLEIIKTSKNPLVVIRLNDLIMEILNKIHRDNLKIKIDKGNKVSFLINGKWYSVDKRVDSDVPIQL